jgi:hypothetical protein
MYLYHVLFSLINICGIDCQKAICFTIPKQLVFGPFDLLLDLSAVVSLFFFLPRELSQPVSLWVSFFILLSLSIHCSLYHKMGYPN